MAAFLAPDEARSITSQAFSDDGGLLWDRQTELEENSWLKEWIIYCLTYAFLI